MKYSPNFRKERVKYFWDKRPKDIKNISLILKFICFVCIKPGDVPDSDHGLHPHHQLLLVQGQDVVKRHRHLHTHSTINIQSSCSSCKEDIDTRLCFCQPCGTPLCWRRLWRGRASWAGPCTWVWSTPWVGSCFFLPNKSTWYNFQKIFTSHSTIRVGKEVFSLKI